MRYLRPALFPVLFLAVIGCTSPTDDERADQERVDAVAIKASGPTTTAAAIDDAPSEGPPSAPGPPTSVSTAVVPTGPTASTAASVVTTPPVETTASTVATGDPTTTSTTTASTSTSVGPTTSTTTAQPTTSTSISGDITANPIVVPASLLVNVAASGPARCKNVDLHEVPVPANPGFRGETLGSEAVSADEHWAIGFYTMLYANCERQARGLEPFAPYTAEKQVAMQQTVLGISEAHGGFGARADIAGGLAAEGHGGGPLVGLVVADRAQGEDDDGNGVWSASEVARRAASGNQHNDGAGLVDHGDAMTSTTYRCVFAAASLGPSADERLDLIIFYGSTC